MIFSDMRIILHFLIVSIITGVFGCSNPTKNKPVNSVITDSINDIGGHDEFLSLFADTSFKVLHVYTLSPKLNGEKFKGILIDSSFYPIFGKNIEDFVFRDSDNKPIINYYRGNLYACYKFKLSDKYTGLIIREPNQYCELAIELWIFDNDSNKLFRSVELADSYGDDNVFFNKDGWIQMVNGNTTIITHRENHEMVFLNNSATNDSIFSNKFQFYGFELDQFVEVDTIPILEKDFIIFNN
jgi:hypothetical protein